LSAGATAGVPLSPHSVTFPDGRLLNGATGPNDLFLKPYMLGGEVEARLLVGFSAVVEVQYERIHQDVAYINVKAGQSNLGTTGGASANVWLFPLLVRYNIPHSRLAPFVNTGATLRHLGALDGRGTQLDFALSPQPISLHSVPGGNPEAAITVGAGLRKRISRFDLITEVRFLHWTSGYFVPVKNQTMLQVGLAFPAHGR
jgi:hypothetical protein